MKVNIIVACALNEHAIENVSFGKITVLLYVEVPKGYIKASIDHRPTH